MSMPPESPVLVLLPGLDGTGDLFAPLLSALGPRFDTVVVRYPTAEPTDYAGLVAFAGAALPFERPFVIVAESFSGPVGIWLAAQRPSRLRGLVLCSTFARSPRPAFAGLAGRVHAIPMNPLAMRVALTAMHGFRVDSALRTEIARTVGRIPHAVLRARLASVLTVDARSALAEVDVPLLYLQASRDVAVPASAAKLIRRIKPDVDVVRLEGPHFLLQVRADTAAAEIARFADFAAPAR